MRIEIKYHVGFYTISHEGMKIRILIMIKMYIYDFYGFNFYYFTF